MRGSGLDDERRKTEEASIGMLEFATESCTFFLLFRAPEW
jgi:hypothetical protein